jgi:predicted ATPase
MQLLHHLRTRKLLLILDNYEHLLPRTELISEILGATPDVKIIVTSRQRLNVQEEWGFPIRGLSYPQHAISNHTDFDTVQLFEQRAAQADAHFQLTETDKPFIVRICEVAQGNPLAIELAAAWTRLLSCQEIAEAIENNWDFASTELRNVPERHRSMNAVFEHSWSGLSSKEQTGFMKLSIFRNGFIQSAAQDVADTPIALLTSLRDKSFLTHSANGRYEIHELLRRYGEMRLNEQPGELADTQGKFIAHYGNLLEDLRDAMWDSRHKQAVTQIKGEIDNIRHAWNLALLRSSWGFFNQSAESVWHYYNDTNLFEEGIALFQQAIARLAPVMHDSNQAFVLAQLFHGPGWFAQRLGRVVEAKRLANQSISFLNTSGLRHVHKEMLIKGSACFIALSLKDYHEARRYAEEILASGQQSGDEQVLAGGNFFHGVISRATADFNAARIHLYEAARAFEKFGSQWIRAYVLSEVGQVELATENWSTAKTLLRKSINLFYEHDDIGNVSATLSLLGTASLKLGLQAEGAAYFYEALQKSSSVHALPITIDALIEIALLLVDAAELATASDILKIVHSRPEIRHDARLRVDRILTSLNRSSLPVPDNEVETTDDIQQAIALALKVENLLRKK